MSLTSQCLHFHSAFSVLLGEGGSIELVLPLFVQRKMDFPFRLFTTGLGSLSASTYLILCGGDYPHV